MTATETIGAPSHGENRTFLCKSSSLFNHLHDWATVASVFFFYFFGMGLLFGSCPETFLGACRQ